MYTRFFDKYTLLSIECKRKRVYTGRKEGSTSTKPRENAFGWADGGGNWMKDRTKVEISTALTTLLAKKAIDGITVREI